LVAINFRVAAEGRPVFFGVALAALGGKGNELVSWTVHRSVPRADAPDAATVLTALGSLINCGTEQAHWEWDQANPYELTEHPARPW